MKCQKKFKSKKLNTSEPYGIKVIIKQINK